MREPQALSVQFEDPRGQRLGQPCVGAWTDGVFHEPNGWSATAPTTRATASVSELRPDDAPAEARRGRLASGVPCRGQAFTPGVLSALASSSAKKGWLPRFPTAESGLAAERRAEPHAQQLLKRADTQSDDLDRPQPCFNHGGTKLRTARGHAPQAERPTPRPATGYRPARGRADGCSRARAALRGTRTVIGVDLHFPSSNAASRARRWTGGSSDRTSPAPSPRRSARPANANRASASEGREET